MFDCNQIEPPHSTGFKYPFGNHPDTDHLSISTSLSHEFYNQGGRFCDCLKQFWRSMVWSSRREDIVGNAGCEKWMEREVNIGLRIGDIRFGWLDPQLVRYKV